MKNFYLVMSVTFEKCPYIFWTNMQLLRILSEKNSIYNVLFMLHYVLSNSKGKYCMNNVIMCMSILVDRGCVHN